VASNDNAILIADDSEVFRRSVRSYLVRNNFKVCGEAIDGTELLKKAKELEPSLIILDFRMPYMNGIELASVLRRRMPDVRIILLTMYEEVLDYKSLMAAKGLDAAIPKMECFDTLAQCVRGLLPRATETPLSTNGPQAWR
jgi:DNA-binding NarL/FixJ family response regulator